ncbi:MAG TPA: hypothetical protein VG248_12280 [Caulobacteraceae bacterium]|jgi:hypothetical protein|nr:hypothetical protein [Caulobacteraceae bacterium]
MSAKADRGENLAGLPTSQKDRERMALLFFAIAAGPVSWSLQELVNYAFAALFCFPNDEPLQVPTLAGGRVLLWSVNLAALAMAAAGIFAAWTLLQRTSMRVGGEEEEEMPRTTSRIHFFGACGLLTGLGFLVATAFNTVALILVPSCSG